MGLTPDELKIPAFQRKKRLDRQARTPLAWTALDRQKQGLEQEFVKAVALGGADVPVKKTKRVRSVAPSFQRIVLDQPELPVVGSARSSIATASDPSRTHALRAYICAGIVEDTLSKISVAILKLSRPLHIGDRCLFEIDDSLFEEDIVSMQINHKAVKRAKKGDVIGMKITRLPVKGTRFYLPAP